MGKMRAVVADTATHQLTLEGVPIPEPGPDEALVRVKACGICLSDVHVIEGVIIPGHEPAGVIERVGERVPAARRPGQRVLMQGAKPCGACRNCVRGDVLHCLNRKIRGSMCNGAWAEYVTVPYQALVEVPDQIPLEQAAVLTDAVATPYAGLVERAALRPAESIGLWGIGGLGVHAVQVARMIGAAPIIALDPLEAARRRALEVGADHALDPTVPGIEAEVWRLTDGVGLDVAVDVMGANRILAQANLCLGPYGRLIVIGLSPEPIALGDLEETSIDALIEASSAGDREAARSLLRSNRYFGLQSHALLGHLGFENKHLEQLVRLVSTGRLDVSRSISEVMPLEQAPRGVERLATKEGNPIRLVVAP
jgi:threonine dehydrogenase-like Zn-dependent dehydrogenase